MGDVAVDDIGDRTYALRPDVVATVLDHGALLLDLESKYFYLLNPSGWAMTQLFETPTSIDDVVASCRAWGAPDGDIEGIRTTVDQMISERLLEPTPSNSAVVNGHAPTNGMSGTDWEPVKMERQAEPLQRVIVSAFDPSIPLAE
jgi:hypothetical protein